MPAAVTDAAMKGFGRRLPVARSRIRIAPVFSTT
jgi:hypothetical protein